MSSRNENDSVCRNLAVVLAFSALFAGFTSPARADSVTYFGSTGLHGGFFPLFPESLGFLTEVDISASGSGGQLFMNPSGDWQSGTWSAYVDLAADGIGGIGGGSSGGTYSVGPFDDYDAFVSFSSSESVTSGLDAFISSGSDPTTELFATFGADLSPSLEVASSGSGRANVTVTYDYNAPGIVPEPSSIMSLATGLLGISALVRCRLKRGTGTLKTRSQSPF